MAHVKIEKKDGGYTQISLDGQPLKCVTRLGLEITANGAPVVTMDLFAFEQDIELADASLKIGGMEASEELERAMLDYLRRKYPDAGAGQEGTLTLGAVAVTRGLPAASADSIRRDLAAIRDTLARWDACGQAVTVHF